MTCVSTGAIASGELALALFAISGSSIYTRHFETFKAYIKCRPKSRALTRYCEDVANKTTLQ